MKERRLRRLKKKEREEIEGITNLRSITIYCGKLKKNVTISKKNIEVYGWESPCECCGSHGIEVKCKCGMVHIIRIKSW